MSAPILIWHSRHLPTIEQAHALAAYDIIRINGYVTENVQHVWFETKMLARCVPDVILTNWNGEPLKWFIRSTYWSDYRQPDGTRATVIKAGMEPGDGPDGWDWRGYWFECEWATRQRAITYRAWEPLQAAESSKAS